MFLVTKNTEFKFEGGTYTGSNFGGNTYEGSSGQYTQPGSYIW